MESGYTRAYKMTARGEKGLSISVSIPPEVVRRAAEEAGLSIEDFIKQYQAIAHYDRGSGVQYTFESILPDKG